jgi:GntR family transcriptional regulator
MWKLRGVHVVALCDCNPRSGLARHDAVYDDETRPAYPCRWRQAYVSPMPGEFHLSPGPAYAWQQVADHIEARIRSGELAPGARLPGERDLAAEYQVALGTARRAIGALREKGLLVTAPSKGTFITSG